MECRCRGSDSRFLATHSFSPSDSKEAKIVILIFGRKGDWEIRTHAGGSALLTYFDILQRGGVRYLIVACALKSA